MLSSEIIITLHFSIGYHPTHNKKRQWWSSQLLPRGTSAGVIENLFWWHQFVEILKTLSLRKNRGQTVVQSKQGSSSLPRKESNKRKSEKNCLLSWNLNEGAPQGTILGPRRISMSSVFSRTTKLIFEGTLKGSWELSFTPGCSSINALQYKTKLTENIFKKQKI